MDEWARKGATLSDRTARKEYGLSQEQIEDAIRAGTLRYRLASMHGNPWLRLLRRDVENLVRASHGEQHFKQRQTRAELARVDRELKRLRAQIAELEQRRSKLTAKLSSQ
jgi:septal ring factor EnvC (AmiA/AmiB activator)